jgi:hypothetical protein
MSNSDLSSVQIRILRLLTQHTGKFDRWRRLVINGVVATTHGSTIPYTLFVRGYIVVKDDQVVLTELGLKVINEVMRVVHNEVRFLKLVEGTFVTEDWFHSAVGPRPQGTLKG